MPNEDSRTGQIDVTKIRETNFLRSETRRWAEPDKQACNVAGPSVDCIGGPCEPLELVLTEDLDLLLDRTPKRCRCVFTSSPDRPVIGPRPRVVRVLQ